MENDEKAIALFDFDGTLTTKDSLIDFIQYAVGKPAFYFGLLWQSPKLAAFALKLMSNNKAKESLLGHYFAGWEAERFEQVARQYSLTQIDRLMRPKGLERILWHQAQGHRVVVVSASMESWLQAWCHTKSVELIGTQLEIKAGRVTGKFASNNCHGQEKVNRIKAQYNLADYQQIYAYGDTSGDTEMLELADKPHFRVFEV